MGHHKFTLTGSINVGDGLRCVHHGVSTLEAVGHASEVDPPTRRAELAAKGEHPKPLAAARTLLALAGNGAVALRAALLLGTQKLVVGARTRILDQ